MSSAIAARIVAVVWVLNAARVVAQPTPPPVEAAPDAIAGEQAPATVGEVPEHRPILDMNGGMSAAPGTARGWLEEPGVEGEDLVLFMPRLVVSVPRVALALTFWPIRQGLTVIERYAVIEQIEDFLYNDARTAGVLPTATYQSGFGFTYGSNVFHNSLLGHDETLSFSARAGGRYAQAYQLKFAGDHVAGSRFWLEVRARYEVDPVEIFAGVGSQKLVVGSGPPQGPRDVATKTYYRQDRLLGLLRFGYTMGQLGEQTKTGLTVIFNRREFAPHEGSATRTSVENAYDTARVPGFDDGVTLVELNGNLVIDFRDRRGLRAAGTYFELFGGGAPRFDHYGFWHYGAELSHTIDLYKHSRLLMLRAAIEAVEAEDERIPFTDLPRLGGPNRLRGYSQDRFRDKRAVLASVEYHYPIHNLLMGQLFVDVGTVGQTYGDLVEEFSDWRAGYGGGLLFGSEDGISIRFDISYGDGWHFYLSGDIAHAFEGRSKQL